MNNKNVALLNTLGLLGITFVLLMGSVLQVVLNELPCPLCLLQRLGFMMVMFGFMLNVIYGPQQRHYGVLIIGALFGAATALRQVSLHVIPGTPGFGSPIFGIHYYTWAFIIFCLTIVGVAVLQLLWNKSWNNTDYKMSRFGKFVCLLAIFAVVVNVASTFIECGPYQCPDNPVSYWLFN
ncbi:disulfide bond formation protein B [Photobacterium sp. NCIMB 13483]|uniref:Disulfide bond formation protein B n=1 Tax=Photobacterium piscicola TaxID=1378299 RepID=A0A1T5I4K4_9GAMM|nr:MULTISPECIES: disulfide bond formation protein B [Photobacterium]PST86346.1 disulfide bond formation protein B [Photobacterium sp. NCIMB 13483]SKC34059.1 disulfide bond formation protein B [Photobacterium piscicola]